MDVLSAELLLAILIELKRISLNKDFSSCLVVCKKWSRTATPILYGHIALEGSQAVGLFARCFQPSLYGEHVRSITLKLEHNGAGGDSNTELRLVTSILPHLGNLSSFSLHTRANPASREALISLLEELPVSCTSLELDTYHDDVYGLGSSIQPAHIYATRCGPSSDAFTTLVSGAESCVEPCLAKAPYRTRQLHAANILQGLLRPSTSPICAPWSLCAHVIRR